METGYVIAANSLKPRVTVFEEARQKDSVFLKEFYKQEPMESIDTVNFHSKPFNITVIQAYAPSSNVEEA